MVVLRQPRTPPLPPPTVAVAVAAAAARQLRKPPALCLKRLAQLLLCDLPTYEYRYEQRHFLVGVPTRPWM